MTRVPGTQEYSPKARLNLPFIFKGYPVLFWWCLLWCWFLGCVGLVHRRSGGHGWGDGASWAGYDFHTYPHPARRIPMPRDVMVEVVNSLGLKLLAIHNENNENNIAISPYGALSILVALGEGLQGEAVKELQKAVHLPNDIALIRIGLRDIHRHLQSYFIPKEGFLAGLTLNHENVTLRHDYEEILKFYGFDSMSFNNALYPEPLTTEKPIDITTTENPGREMTMEITSEAVSDSGISTLKTTSSLFESITTEPSITSTETTVSTTTNDITTVPSTTAKETATTIEPTVFTTTTKDTTTTEATVSTTIAKEGTTTEAISTTIAKEDTTTEPTAPTTIAKESTTTEPTAPTTNAKESTATEATISTMIAKEGTTIELNASTTTAKESITTTEATISTTIAKEGTTTELTAPTTTAKESTIVEPTPPTITAKDSSTESTETTATTKEITTTESAIITPTTEENTTTVTEESTSTTTKESTSTSTEENTTTTTEETTTTKTTIESTSTTTEESTSKTTEESTIITTVTTTSDDISITPSTQKSTIIELLSTMKQSVPSTTIFTTSSTEITSEEDASTKIDSFTTEMTTIKEDSDATSTISYNNPITQQIEEIEEESTQNDDSIQDIEKSSETTSTAPTTTTESSPSETDTRTITDEVTLAETKEEITTEQTREEITMKQSIEEIITEQTTEEITSNQQTTQEFTTEQNPKEEITKNTTEEEYDEDKKSTEVVDVKGETETTTLLDFPYPDATKPVDTDITTPKTNENEINNDGTVITKRKRSSRSNYVELNKEKLFKEIRKPRSVLDYVIAGHHHDNPLYNQDYIENYRLVPHVPQTQPRFLVQGKYEEYQVNYMKYDTVLPFFYVSYYNALALSFPLDSDKYYLLLLLPTDANGIDKLICDLRLNGSLKYIIDGLRYRHVVAVIPSFMLKGYINLTPSLQKLGIRRVFEPGQADFSPMTDLKQIYITNIEQAITVNIRNYVDADSLSNTWQYKEDEPVEFTADHPFLYFVMDAELDVTLMSGKIVNPLNSRIT